MYVLAIYDLPEDRETLGAPLAEALGKTLYEANARLRSPGSGPFIVGVFEGPDAAKEMRDKLRAAGFQVTAVSHDDVAKEGETFLASDFSFEEQEIHVASKQGESLDVPYGSVYMLLHGVGTSSFSSSTDTVTEKKFSVGRAVMTSGLSTTKKVSTTVKSTQEVREPFIRVYAEGIPVLVFRESGLRFEGLGDELQPTRIANFNLVVSRLQEKCPQADFDNRLLHKPEQIALLGPVLSSEDQLIIGISLLKKVIADL